MSSEKSHSQKVPSENHLEAFLPETVERFRSGMAPPLGSVTGQYLWPSRNTSQCEVITTSKAVYEDHLCNTGEFTNVYKK